MGGERKWFRRTGTVLFDQQMWCWGRDVVRPEGNLLIAYGFTRCGRESELFPRERWISAGGGPEQRVSTSGYVLRPSETVPPYWVGLWGWGMLYGTSRTPTLFLRRFTFEPRLLSLTSPPTSTVDPDDLQADTLPPHANQRSELRSLFAAALRWIAEYERWVEQTVGFAYRHRCVQQWFKKGIPAQEMTATWEQLAHWTASQLF